MEISPQKCPLIGYLEVTWHLIMKLFPDKIPWAGNILVTHESCDEVFLCGLYIKSLNYYLVSWNHLILFPEAESQRKKTVSLGNALEKFTSEIVLSSFLLAWRFLASHKANHRITWKRQSFEITRSIVSLRCLKTDFLFRTFWPWIAKTTLQCIHDCLK